MAWNDKGWAQVSEVEFRILPERQQVMLVSGSVEGLLGFSPEQFVSGKVSLQDRIHPDDADLAAELLSLQNQRDNETFSLRIRHADGKIRCVAARVTQEGTKKGGTVLKLTLKDAKGQSQDRIGLTSSIDLQSVLESVDECAYLKDRNHVYIAVNRKCRETISELSGELRDVIGLTDYDLFSEDFADHTYQLEKRILSGSQFAHEVQETTKETGQVSWMDERKFAVRDAGGEVVGIFGTSSDITEGLVREHALEESEANLREAQEIARIGSFVLDVERQILKGSEVWHMVLGIAKDSEPTLQQLVDLVYPDDLAGLAAEFGAASLNAGRMFDKECRIIRPTDHAVRWMHLLGKVELDAHKKAHLFRGTLQDITDRKLAEAAIQESSGLLQIFIQDAPTGLAMFDRDMRYIAASRRWLEDHGMQEWEFIGRSHYDLMPEIPTHWRDEHSRALAGETVVSGEDSYVDKHGQLHWKLRMVRPWLKGSGEVGGIVILAEDITQRKLAEMSLHESKELLQLFIEHAPAALAMFDREMHYIAASRRWVEDFRLQEKTIIGHSHYEIFPELPERWKEAHRRALAGETIESSEDSFTRSDGSLQWLRWEARPWWTGDDAIGGIMIFTEDITQSKLSEERLHLAASVFTHASEGITITDANANILDVNDAFTRITGYTREEVIGKNPRILNSGRQTREFYSEMWNKLHLKGHWSGEIWNRAKDGHIFAEMLTISAVRDAAGKTQQYVAMFSDITSIKEQKKQLEHVAQHDLLTGLPNRVLLADRLRQALAHAHRSDKPVAIACLDLDNFKAINDQHGHMIGDDLLTALAHRMKKELHEDDTLARLGGDEFVVVMPELTRQEDSIAMIGALLRTVEDPVLLGDLALQVSASIGVTFFPQPEDVDADQLLRQADQAMYQAKLEGKGRFHAFDPRVDRDLRGHHEDIERIRNALKAREFVLYFQPKVNMRTGELLGAEGLIRWQHPLMGLLPPAQFLPILEGHPLAIELGEWVIDSALSHLENFQGEGLEISVSVNVAAQQLQQEGFADRISELLALHPQVSPSRLELEVLESSALEDVAVVSKAISDCRSLGVTFSLDDFGTGYSSLSYLKRLPVDVLKIDQTFVHDMLDDPEDLTILEGVLSLATAFRRRAIAEGVETVEHGVMLLRLGCQEAQGYGIARPMPAGELAKWAANWRTYPQWANAVPIDATDRPLLCAGVELASWTVMIEEFVAGRRHLVPRMDRRECRLGTWFFGETLAGRHDRPGVKDIETLHEQMHNLAEEIIALKAGGRAAAAAVGLEELHALRDELLEKLESLVQMR